MQYLLSYQQAPVRSGTRTSSRANAGSLRHRPATRCTSARRGATYQIPLTNWTIGVSHGGRPPKPPKQEKGVAEGDGDERKAQAVDEAVRVAKPFLSSGVAVALYVNAGIHLANSLGGVMVWYSSMATKADVTESEGRVLKSVESVQKSVGTLQILVIGQAIVGAFVAGLCIAVVFAGKGNGSK